VPRSGNNRLTREQIAAIEVGHTEISPRTARCFTLAFIAFIGAVPALQSGLDLYRSPRHRPQVIDVFAAVGEARRVFHRTAGSLGARILRANAAALKRIRAFEDDLDDHSLLTTALLGRTQEFLLKYLGQGNENAYPGRERRLFYRPGIDSVSGPGFLDSDQLALRRNSGDETKAAPHPDPRTAILDFARQLRARDIQLVLVPTPSKATVLPEYFSRRLERGALPPRNPSFQTLVAELRGAGVLVFDPVPTLLEARRAHGRPQFLETDSHWTPEAMETVARDLARFLRERTRLPPPGTQYRRVSEAVSNLGDVARMLRLPSGQNLYRRQTVSIRQVLTAAGTLWRPRRDAPVLLLGDSFANVYSSAEMGWGEAAGLTEQLSFCLALPVDRISRNDAGAFATRRLLSRELGRGRDRLLGKRVVVWEFAERELSVGDWQVCNLKLGRPRPTHFLTLAPGQSLVIDGVIQEVSPVPRPGAVPYKDHIATVHLIDLRSDSGPTADNEALVYMWSMRNGRWTRVAHFREGQRVHLRLRPWSEVADRYGAVNRSEADNDDLALEEPCWGEEIEP